jgi:hypothetical protein
MRETRVVQARRLAALLPAIIIAEAIETTRIRRDARETGDPSSLTVANLGLVFP